MIFAESFKLLMQVIVLFITQKRLAVTLPVCMGLVYIVQKFYLRTSRQLRFLELESQADVFSSFLESVSIYTQLMYLTDLNLLARGSRKHTSVRLVE